MAFVWSAADVARDEESNYGVGMRVLISGAGVACR